MKTVLFVPGFRETFESRDYKSVVRAIESQGYLVEFVPINWSRTSIGDWVKQLDEVYAKHDPKHTALAGFSYGSMTALMSAAKQNPAELWLFSLSPYFSDDMPKMKQSWLNNIGHRRADAFRKLDFAKLADSIHCRTLIVVGEIETKKYPLIGKRSASANKLIKNSTLITVAEAGHDVSDKNYLEAIVSAI